MMGAVELRREYFTTADRARFAAFVDKTDRCWLWRGAKTQYGYGVFTQRRSGKKFTVSAHRAQFAIRNGVCPSDKVICHSCDVKNCVNPDHLWAGSNDDNMADMAAKGTLKGEKNPLSKLDVWDVI